ncbi:cis-3-hydroxy-L-proline dehydratase [Rhizobium halophilum]|uniref:cis-3-hydroxy-L-proline dehydratase n=1 Tax=Rhizobium halophilum TaxID=2846852 RepID=UPI001EFD10FD|nr:aconitase X [Rhizobium halophilum]MCF6368065.1 aconitase X [Rhizobium halophilum]
MFPERCLSILPGEAEGAVLVTDEPLSFWGGVSPDDARVIDVHHSLHGLCLSGSVLLMPSSRGSCSGSGVFLDLILNGRAPAALIFSGSEDVLTLGALVAAMMFAHSVPVVRVTPSVFQSLSTCRNLRVTQEAVEGNGITVPLDPPPTSGIALTEADRAMLSGEAGPSVQQAMQIICAMAAQQGAPRLVDVTQAHVDGCIYASPANLTFAERMADLGARVRIPTTLNAISVDHENWRAQEVPAAFGVPAARLADAYVRMGCRPTYTCSPYLLPTAPKFGEMIAWAESNAVIFANSILGARSPKHPDFLDLCIALTGRAPFSGVYLHQNRRAHFVVDVELPAGADDALWPLIGYAAGQIAPDRIPLLRGLAPGTPSVDDLKALCAAFGTTSAVPMLHIEGITPEAASQVVRDLPQKTLTRAQLAAAWDQLSSGPERIDLVAIGSPHASLDECRAFASALARRKRHADVSVIITAGRHVIAEVERDGTLAQLASAGVNVFPDLCWCSISEPLFPPKVRTVMTNSGKYAHYGPGLSGRHVRLGSIAQCADAVVTGRAPAHRPAWLA